MGISRRRAITLGLSAVSTPRLGSQLKLPSAGLAQAALGRGRFFGAAVKASQLSAQPDLRSAIQDECGLIVPEIELKWAAVEPNSGQASFADVDYLAQFAVNNCKTMRGHTLLWHGSVPGWALEALRGQSDWGIISNYFALVIPRYKDVVQQWDVINEPIDTGHRMDGLRENVFLQTFGPDYIHRALLEARSLAPNAQLLINDFGFEYDTIEERNRRYLFLKLIDRLKNAGAPLDGVGLQSHLDLRKGSISQPSVAAFLEELANFGLTVVVTELDVKESNYAASAPQRDELVAAEARRYLDVVLDQRAVSGVITWGLSDRQSWLDVTSEDRARFPGAWREGPGPGLNRGLPLDASLRRKRLYFALRDALVAL